MSCDGRRLDISKRAKHTCVEPAIRGRDFITIRIIITPPGSRHCTLISSRILSGSLSVLSRPVASGLRFRSAYLSHGSPFVTRSTILLHRALNSVTSFGIGRCPGPLWTISSARFSCQRFTHSGGPAVLSPVESSPTKTKVSLRDQATIAGVPRRAGRVVGAKRSGRWRVQPGKCGESITTLRNERRADAYGADAPSAGSVC